MRDHQRKLLVLLAIVAGLAVSAAPAGASDWFSFHISNHGFGLSFGSADWWVYGDAWSNPHWAVDYETVLTGYGEWLWVDGLGRVWRPYVAVGWRPFTHGRWVYTSLGWTWVSYEPWGYFPHHYGHWAYSHYGWVWAPGYSYWPANVTWVYWGSYVGWYPCPPRGWSHAARGFHHGYRHGYHDGYRDGWHDARYATYTQWNHLSSHDVSRHAVARSAVERSAARTTLRTASTAPARAELRRRGAEMVPEARVARRTVQVGDQTVVAVRPEGMRPSVERHAARTVERALPTQVSRRMTNADAARRQITNADAARARPTNADAARLRGTNATTVRRDRSSVAPPSAASRQRHSERTEQKPAQFKPSSSVTGRSHRSQAVTANGSAARQDATRRRPVIQRQSVQTGSPSQSSARQPTHARQQQRVKPNPRASDRASTAAGNRPAPRTRATSATAHRRSPEGSSSQKRDAKDVSTDRSHGTKRARRR